jgi:hypothetical protein
MGQASKPLASSGLAACRLTGRYGQRGGWRSVAFEVHDLDAAIDCARSAGYELVGGIGEYEGSWRMAYVRGPEGIIVALAQPIG